jgi:CDP-paratose 2-epimerase
VARFIKEFINAPRIAEVYNIGGGKNNTCSILEAFDIIAKISGKKMIYNYSEVSRIGDHICYYSDLSKMKEHYPNWDITKSLEVTIQEIYDAWINRIS